MNDTVYWRSLLTPEELLKGEQLGPAQLEALPETAFNPDGRYFISYRSVDGRGLADEFQTRLRAAGLSAWRDDADLDFGQIRKRLMEALTGTGLFSGSSNGRSGGLAGAVLVATPRVWTSAPVRHVEAPIILHLAQRYEDEGFHLAIANAVPASPAGGADNAQVDDVYGISPKVLEGYLMADATTTAGCELVARRLLERRVERRLGMLAGGHPFRINVDSRQPLGTTTRLSPLYGESDLMVRLHQEEDRRWPALEALEAYASAMADLKSAIEGRVPVQFSGQIHATVALALGATFSARRRGQVIECLHERQDVISAWRSDAPMPATPRTFSVRQQPGGDDSGDKVLVTIVASCTPHDRRAFDALARRPGFKAIHRIELDSPSPIQAEEGNDLAERLAATLATFGAEDDLHVAFVGPWALALLLGHHLSTTNYVSYEWDNTRTRPAYQECLRINPGVDRHLSVAMPSKEKP